MKIIPIRFDDKMVEALKKAAEELGLGNQISTTVKVILNQYFKQKERKEVCHENNKKTDDLSA